MGILDMIRNDARRYITDTDGFATTIHFQAPNGGMEVDIPGRSNKHHISFDQTGTPVNLLNASITISEKVLTDAGYPVRNADNLVTLRGHRVSWTDSTGIAGTYSIKECFPDQSVGIIVCILNDFKNA
jgi:hypothetical protein